MAYQATQNGNTLLIFIGNYPGTLSNMSKPLLLQSTNGVVNIGVR